MGEELRGKVAVVTGGASGIGHAIVTRFVAEGARVVVADVDSDRGHEVVAELGDAARFCRTDVSERADLERAVDRAVGWFGGLDVMVNNAGVSGPMVRFLHDDLEEFDRVVAVNLFGVLAGCQVAARWMRERGGGSIINTASTAGIDAGAGLIPYRATKAAVIHASRSIAVDVAQYLIRVNCVVPGQIRTAMTTYDMDSVMEFTQPLPRRGRPEDVAEAALFFASERSAHITGTTLPVDGGTTAGPPASLVKRMLGGGSAGGGSAG
jgi:NAD(P)-dependent dehydrogenase (short-subunit alcohol dehydrogenase family)